MRAAMIVEFVALIAVTTSCGSAATTSPHASTGHPAATHTTPHATSTRTMSGNPVPAVSARDVGPDPRVGAIFLGGPPMHTCTGSILHSAAGDLILTAAHCMVDGVEASFVPGFIDSAEPGDFWQIDEVYLDPRWLADQDPAADFAVARVSRDGGGSIEATVGRGFGLGPAPVSKTSVTVTGYAFGEGGSPIGCTTRTANSVRGFPALLCAGLVNGTSGSPWTTGSTAVGVIGGLEGGGCDENVSYSAPFDDAVARLLTRAEAGGPGDVPPAVFDDDC